jgi:hypothetical protein
MQRIKVRGGVLWSVDSIVSGFSFPNHWKVYVHLDVKYLGWMLRSFQLTDELIFIGVKADATAAVTAIRINRVFTILL